MRTLLATFLCLFLAGPLPAQFYPSPFGGMSPMGSGVPFGSSSPFGSGVPFGGSGRGGTGDMMDPFMGVSIPVHGNWCGPNYGSGPIVDALDAACYRHDFCVFQQGRYDCGCDLALMQELQNTPWPNANIAKTAHAIYDMIAMTPCDDPVGMRAKLSNAAADWAFGVMSGQEKPWDIMDRLSRLIADGMSNAY